MSKIDCRNHLKNCCCILTGGECTHETCTFKEPELDIPLDMTAENCPYRSDRVLQDNYGKFHLCYKDGGDCECIPNGCPYLIAKNSRLNLPDLPGYTQI